MALLVAWAATVRLKLNEGGVSRDTTHVGNLGTVLSARRAVVRSYQSYRHVDKWYVANGHGVKCRHGVAWA